MKIIPIALLTFTTLTFMSASGSFAYDTRAKRSRQPEIEVNLNLLQGKNGPAQDAASPFSEQSETDKIKKPRKHKKAKHKKPRAKKPAARSVQCPPTASNSTMYSGETSGIPALPRKVNTAPEVKIVEKKHDTKSSHAPLVKNDMEEGFPVIVSNKGKNTAASKNDGLPEISALPPLEPAKKVETVKQPVAIPLVTRNEATGLPPLTDSKPALPDVNTPKTSAMAPVIDSKPLPPALPSVPPVVANTTIPTAPVLPPVVDAKANAVQPPALPAIPTLPVKNNTTASSLPPQMDAPALPNVEDTKKDLLSATPPALPPVASTTATASASDLQLVFGETETDLPLNSAAKLDGIVAKLNQDKDARVNILAYASGPEALSVYPKRVSLARGIAVRNYFTNKGISVERVAAVKALGNKNEGGPANRVDIFIIK